MTIQEWIKYTEKKLTAADVPSARLDAELLLAHALEVDRTWLVTHGDDELKSEKAESLVALRLQREPIAYITGHKEFYGREFKVTPDVLIPRPETEDLVDLTLESTPSLREDGPLMEKVFMNLEVVDVGTGSGCVGVTLKLERPEWNVTLSDLSPKALAAAKQNAKKLSAKVEFVQSDLLSAFSNIQHPTSNIYFDLIVANLPYVSKSWETSPETAFEPSVALFADEDGLALIRKLIVQSASHLKPSGCLVLEADPCQHAEIIAAAEACGLRHIKTKNYAVAFFKNLN